MINYYVILSTKVIYNAVKINIEIKIGDKVTPKPIQIWLLSRYIIKVCGSTIFTVLFIFLCKEE